MANNTYKNKVVYGGETLIDLTNDDVTRADVVSGKYFHLPTGERTTGTNTYDADTSDATAVAAEILDTKTAYKNGAKITGTMPNRGSQTGSITTKTGLVSILQGYHDGGGSVGISSAEQEKLIATNIRQGVTILGVEGEMSGGEDINATQASVTPYTTSQTLVPTDFGAGYNSISQINVAAIAYSESDNAAGGVTVTIGTVAPSAQQGE